MGAFRTPTREAWEAAARKALKDRPLEELTRRDPDGLAIALLYTADDGGEALCAPRAADADGRAWDLRMAVEADSPAEANAEALADLQNGAASLLLSGAVLADPDPLIAALQGVALELAPVGLGAGLDGPDAANALAVAAKGAPRARLMFHMDPLSAFAVGGGAPRPIAEHLTLAANTAARHAGAYPEADFFLASGQVVHEAGGSNAQELGFAAASALAYLKAGVEAGLPLERAARGLWLGLTVDAVYFDALAKVRALRRIWAGLTAPLGLTLPARIEARSSRRMLAARDPWPNLLRLTAAGFAGAVGGAEAIVLEGFTRAAGRPDAFARRQARNTQLVLMEEAHLGRVDDPAAGSWFLDARTRDLAAAGWAEFQRIEAEGGLAASLLAGAFQARVAEARAALETAHAGGGQPLVGVTRFIDPEPRPAPVVPLPTLPAPLGQIAPLSPLPLVAGLEEAAR